MAVNLPLLDNSDSGSEAQDQECEDLFGTGDQDMVLSRSESDSETEAATYHSENEAAAHSDGEDEPGTYIHMKSNHGTAAPAFQHFDSNQYVSGPATTPLYEGAGITLLEAIAKHLLWFTEHPGTSKLALTSILELQHHHILPHGNILPDSYRSAMKLVNDFLIQPLVFDVCPNDCIIFRGDAAYMENCPHCGANRYKPTGKEIPVRRFYYLPIGPRLERIFGTSNFAQLIQAHRVSLGPSTMFDVHDSPVWKSAYSDTGIFKGDPRGIALGLCTDGVNPFSHLRCTYSMWPIVLSLLNLPRDTRHNFQNMLLVGIIPGNNGKEAHSIQPYLEVLVDEILHLQDVQLYDTYRQANFNLKVSILLYILDYPGIGKVFNVHGAGSYMGCVWCDIKGT